MIRFAVLCLCVLVCSESFGRTILLVTPKGVYQSEVTNGIPGPWTPSAVDVIVQGFGTQPPGDDPIPPATDPVVAKVSEISRRILEDKSSATGLAALVDALAKQGLTGAKFREAMELAVPIADTALDAHGTYIAWSKAVLPVTDDPQKLEAGLVAAWGIELSALETIHSAAAREEGDALPAEALDFAAIIALITMILNLLKTLGII